MKEILYMFISHVNILHKYILLHPLYYTSVWAVDSCCTCMGFHSVFLLAAKRTKKKSNIMREIIYSALFLQKPRAFHHMYACRYYYKCGRSDEYGTVERATHAKAMRCRIHTKNSMTNILYFWIQSRNIPNLFPYTIL